MTTLFLCIALFAEPGDEDPIATTCTVSSWAHISHAILTSRPDDIVSWSEPGAYIVQLEFVVP